MAEKDEHHDTCTGHRHCHADDGRLEQFSDPGGRQLAAALRTSFRLLGAIMALGVAAFLAMGFRSVEPGKVAVETVFGKIVGVTTEGLAYNWPEPIGRIEEIYVGERTITIHDFWMFETKSDQLKANLREREVPRGGLRPGLDGALLTGDRNLLHVRLRCTYALSREWDPAKETDPVLRFKENVSDPNETMRSALCGAAIRAAAVRTADGLQRTERAVFESDVRKGAQETLDAMATGLSIRTVKVVDSTWPLRTLDDYDAAQRAVNEAEQLKNTARGVAVTLLDNTAGPAASRMLVGEPADVTGSHGPSAPSSRPAADAGTEYNLIGQYNLAVRRGRHAEAEQVRQRIENVLLSGAAEGQVRRVLREARGYRSATIESVAARVKQFNELLPAYRENPQFALSRWWVEAREEILESPTAEKHYLTPSEQKTVLRINRDPDIVRETERSLMKKTKP